MERKLQKQSTQRVLQEYMCTKVDPILEDMIQKIALERPEDPAKWMADYLANPPSRSKRGSVNQFSAPCPPEYGTPEPKVSSSPNVRKRHSMKYLESPSKEIVEPGAPKKPGEEKIEMDTAEDEDSYNLDELLLPRAPAAEEGGGHGGEGGGGGGGGGGGKRLPDFDKFSVSYSQRLLNGWVKQPSPCCAAASVAGAWNAVRGLPRRHPAALGHTHVLAHMTEMLEGQLREKQGRFERLLGCRTLDPLLEALTLRLEADGYPRAPRKSDPKPTRRHLLRAVKALVREACAAASAAAAADGGAAGAAGAGAAAGAATGDGAASDEGAGAAAAAVGRGEEEAGEQEGAGGEDCCFRLLGRMYEEEGYRTEEDDGDGDAKDAEDDENVPPDEREDDDEEGDEGKADGGGGGNGGGGGALATRLAGGQRMLSLDEEGSLEEDDGSLAAGGLDESLAGGLSVSGQAAGGGGGGGGGGRAPPKRRSAAARKGGARPRGSSSSSAAGGKARRSLSKQKSRWAWKRDLLEILNKKKGLYKVTAERPSTAAFGNWGILGAVARLSDADPELPYAIKASVFMGRKAKGKKGLPVPLSSKDSDELISSQWAQLRSAFLQEDTALIFHLKNHYALIFALRESTNTVQKPDGRSEKLIVREMLTARKGQRPTAWIPWDEARQTMIGWLGYKIMIVQPQKQAPAFS